jgi:hypothetical protein
VCFDVDTEDTGGDEEKGSEAGVEEGDESIDPCFLYWGQEHFGGQSESLAEFGEILAGWLCESQFAGASATDGEEDTFACFGNERTFDPFIEVTAPVFLLVAWKTSRSRSIIAWSRAGGRPRLRARVAANSRKGLTIFSGARSNCPPGSS